MISQGNEESLELWCNIIDGATFLIPDVETVPLPPSIVLQGRYSDWEPNDSNVVADMRGRSPKEVEHEASRIRLGEIFFEL